MSLTRPIAVLATMTLAMPALGQDGGLPAHQLVYDSELVAALDADDPQAIAFIAGAMGALQLRGVQGDPLLYWVPRCAAATFAGPQSLVDGVRAYAGDRPAAADGTQASWAVTAVLHALAAFCAEQGLETEPPQ